MILWSAVVGWALAAEPGNIINPSPFWSALELATAYSFPVTYLKGGMFSVIFRVTAVFDGMAGQ